jgi:hypothetical protein
MLVTYAPGNLLYSQDAKVIYTGRVVGQENKPLASASIIIFDQENKELMKLSADSSGYFSIPDFSEKIGSIFISHSGYKAHRLQIMPSMNKDLGLIRLSGIEGTLNEVVVTSSQKLVETDGGNITYNVSRSIDAQGITALDALKKAPGVFINSDNTITLNGKAGVMILLDGKQTYLSGQELADLLKSMPASGIKAFEILNSPTAKYDASGSAGIINIKTNKVGTPGFSGTSTTGVAYGISAKQSQDISLNYRKKNINLFGSYNHFLGNYNYVYGSDRLQSGKNYFSHTDDTDKRQRMGSRLGADLVINKKNTIGVLFNGNFVFGGGITRTTTDISQAGAQGYEQRLYAENDYYFQKTQRYNVNLNYRYEDAGGRSLNLDADYGNFLKGNGNHQFNLYSDEQGSTLSRNFYHSLNDIDIRLKAFKIDYTSKLWKGPLEMGIKYSTVLSGNDARFFHVLGNRDSLDGRRSNTFSFLEEISAAYFNYKRTVGKWNVQGGVRMEHAASEGHMKYKEGPADPSMSIPIKRTHFFPSASIGYKPKEDHSVSLAYSRRIDRPAYQDLNPFVYLLDELSFWQGNPFLQPQLSNRLLLQYVFKSSTIIGIGYTATTGYSARITDTVESIKIVMIPRNLGTQKNMYLSLTQNATLKKWWEVTFNGTVYQLSNQIKFDQYRALDLKQVAARASLQQRFKLPFKIAGEVSAFVNSKRLTGANEIVRATSQLDLAIQKVFYNNKATLRMAVSDIYKGARFYSTQAFEGFFISSYGYYETRQLRISFTYKFADASVKGPRARSSALENESGRIRN